MTLTPLSLAILTAVASMENDSANYQSVQKLPSVGPHGAAAIWRAVDALKQGGLLERAEKPNSYRWVVTALGRAALAKTQGEGVQASDEAKRVSITNTRPKGAIPDG